MSHRCRTVETMTRPARLDPDHGWHHVMNRGARRHDVFLTAQDRHLFLRLLVEACRRLGVEIVAYCLMGNHYHLLLHCPEGGLSETMQRLISVYTRAFNKAHGFDGALFRGRFVSKLITSETYAVTASRYIHLNPTDIGMRYDEYPWSSYRAYTKAIKRPPWLAQDRILELVGGSTAYRDIVEAVRPHDSWVKAKGPDWTPVDLEHVLNTVELGSLEQICSAAAGVCRTDPGCVRAGSRSDGRRSLMIALLLSTGLAEIDTARVAEHFGFATTGAYRSALSRARAAVEDQAELRRLCDEATVTLAPASRIPLAS